MSLPPFAPFPPARIRKNIVSDEWQVCLDSWILLAQCHLLLPSKDFSLRIAKDSSVIKFLLSYVREAACSMAISTNDTASARTLRQESFVLVHRIMTEIKPIPPGLLEWAFWGNISIVYAGSESLKTLLESVWNQDDLDNESFISTGKSLLIRFLETDSQELSQELEMILRQTIGLLKVSYRCGQFLMLGSDFLDSLSLAFAKAMPQLQKQLAAIGYLCLKSLLDPRRPKISTLLDHLYSLNASSNHESLLKGVCKTTPFLRTMRERLSGPESERAKPLMLQLEKFEKSLNSRHKKPILRKMNKGKGKNHDVYDHDAPENFHFHRLSLVTQIQELFPDLGSRFIIKLLDEYKDDTEQVTAHLLDDSLPSHLKHLNQAEELTQPEPPHAPSPKSGPYLPIRRNIYDNDLFDLLALPPTATLTRGRAANSTPTADTLLAHRPSTAKAAILSALAAFDSDSDERDDTYDVSDVGGTVDSFSSNANRGVDHDADLRDGNEVVLFKALQKDKDAFGRDAATRRSPARANLKRETGMTDEALEGWAIMIARDPRRFKRLEARFSGNAVASGSRQRELAATSYREGSWIAGDSSTAEAEKEELDSDADARGKVAAVEDGGVRGGGKGAGIGVPRGLGRGRGCGSGGRGSGNGGDLTGPASERGTQIMRQRKDVEKGARANHNRRDQRARKMARGGLG